MPTACPATTALFSIAGKNVLVTGGSRGIGAMIAHGFAAAGAHVLLTSRSDEACKATVQAIRQATRNDEVHYVTSTLSSRQGCEDLAKQVAERFDCLHVLINNAGTSWGEPLEQDSRQNWGWDKVLDLNVKSLVYLTRACRPLLQKAATPNDPARVINIGSIVGCLPQDAPTHAYDVSKAAVHHWTRKLAGEWAPTITVNCVAPGFVPTRMSAGLAVWGADSQELANQIPLGRMGTQDDMVGACQFLASKAGSWCSGVILPVDGGAVGGTTIPLKSSL